MIRVFAFVACIVVLVAAAAAQDTSSVQNGSVFYDVVSSKSNDTTGRIDVYVQIPYASLTFVRDFNRYRAKYELTVQFRSKQDSIVKERTFLDSIIESNYDATTGKTGKFAFMQKIFTMPVGDFTFTLTLRDDNAGSAKTYTHDVHVPDYAHLPTGMSGILLASRISDIGGRKSVTPYLLSNAGGMRNGLFAFFEVYNRRAPDTIDAAYRATTSNGSMALQSTRIPLAITAARTQQFVKIPTERLSQGAYTLTIGLFPHATDTNSAVEFDSALAETSHPIRIDWGFGVPQTAEDIDKAIDELRWVATADEMDSLRSATTADEKRARFKRFWNRLDPTPGTPRNEAMELYYSRVRYADEHFKGLGDGWASDQGMIYIVFGKPSSVESHPFDYITYGIYRGPYVVWYYDNYNKTFVFIDQDGFGDFRLASPPPAERFEYGR